MKTLKKQLMVYGFWMVILLSACSKMGNGSSNGMLESMADGSYFGLGGEPLSQDRVDMTDDIDFQRIKPYAVLVSEYSRVLGTSPAVIKAASTTFAEVPAPWFAEPLASAQTAYVSLSAAFEGCLKYTEKPAAFAEMPTEESAKIQCETMAGKFWDRDPALEEVTECAQMTLTTTATETAPRRRWAYTCAMLLMSPAFLAY